MLRLILNSHPDVAVPPESRFITELKPAGDEVDPAAYLDALSKHHQFQAWHLDVEAIRDLLGTAPKVSYRSAIEATYLAFARQHKKSRWGDKTPRYVEKIRELSALFPEARFVHLVRDGRTVALSYAHTDFGPKTIAGAAEIWTRRVSLGLETGRALGPERYLEVRYEALATDTETVVKEICGFLEIDFDPKMFDPEERLKGATDRAKRYNPHVAGDAIAKTRSWEEDMPPAQVEVFEAIGGEILSKLGYERRFPNPSGAAKLKARLGLWHLPIGKLKH